MAPSFSNIEIDAASSGIDPTPSGAKRFLRETTEQALDILDRSLSRWSLGPQDYPIVDAMVGRNRMDRSDLASNLRLRNLLGALLIDLLLAMQLAKPTRRFFLVTLISDRWLSFDQETSIWVGGMKDAFRQVLKLGGFDGWFGVLEIQTLDHYVRLLGRLLLPHGHFIAFSDDPDFAPRAAEERMRASGRLESKTGAKTVDIRALAGGSVCNLAAYIMKAACIAKQRVPSRDRPVGFALGNCPLPPVSAVRQAEVLSQLCFEEILLSGGGGQPIREQMIAAIRNFVRLGCNDVSCDEAARFWIKARKRARCERYKPVRIDRTKAQLPRGVPISLAYSRHPGPGWIGPWLIKHGEADAAVPSSVNMPFGN